MLHTSCKEDNKIFALSSLITKIVNFRVDL